MKASKIRMITQICDYWDIEKNEILTIINILPYLSLILSICNYKTY